MTSSHRISVIIPVHNVERYLGECLDSVLHQTMTDIEVVCVDDGSTDGSPSILLEYAAADPRIKVITQPNAGPGPARNRALDVATGECIVFMDPDDKYPDDGTLAALYNALADSGCSVAGGRAVCFPEDVPSVAKQNRKSDRVCAFPKFGIVDYRDYQVPYRYWCYIYKRDSLDGVRFPALRTFQDVPFFVCAMVKARRFFAIDRLVYKYRQHEGNGTRNLSLPKMIDRLRGMKMVMGIAVANRYWRLFGSTLYAFGKNVVKIMLGRFVKHL